MSIENINGYNKIPDKDLRKTDSKTSPAPDAQKSVTDSRDVSQRDKLESRGGKDSREVKEAFWKDLVDISRPDPVESKELAQGLKEDPVEISWQDPELKARIHDLVTKIKEQRADIAKRVEAARILIMRKAYDENHELRKTAEAILRGEDVENIDLDAL